MCNKRVEGANDNNSAGNVPCVNCFSVNMVACELYFMIQQLRCNFSSKGCFEVYLQANGFAFAFVPQLPDCLQLKYLPFGKRGKLTTKCAESCVCDCFPLFP